MKLRTISIGCAALLLSVGVAQAGPCNMADKDAGSGPTPGHTGQTVGSATPRSDEHPPTSTMNRTTGNTATSSQDAQKQMQGEPTAAQQAQGARSQQPGAGDDC
ncbi:hypothetical protein [Bradyrhizobium ivorense]|uniref:hypothetical protein n=1 Tax=Bradyrhizobium ivorense TaxID=2511166 RepID=UPI0010BC2F24|nr:hypothetical protein [Bradyrhizobium ivorense]VIO77467.1 hypothetical protein CI41S_57230 [Bradyrhizobium ivorense]